MSYRNAFWVAIIVAGIAAGPGQAAGQPVGAPAAQAEPEVGEEVKPEAAAEQAAPAPSAAPAAPAADPVQQLKSPSQQMRYEAAVALSRSKDPRGVLALMDALASDMSASVRAVAAWSLGMLNARQATVNLRHAVEQDASPKVRTAAQRALLRMGVAPPKREPERVRVIQQQVMRDPLQDYYDDDGYTSGRRMRTAGMVITLVGGAVGPLVAAIGFSNYAEDNGRGSQADEALRVGVIGAVGTGLCLAIGIPLWAYGQSRINRAWERFEETSAMIPEVNVALGPEQKGISARWRF